MIVVGNNFHCHVSCKYQHWNNMHDMQKIKYDDYEAQQYYEEKYGVLGTFWFKRRATSWITTIHLEVFPFSFTVPFYNIISRKLCG